MSKIQLPSAPNSPRVGYLSASPNPKTPLSPRFNAPLSPRTPLSPRAPGMPTSPRHISPQGSMSSRLEPQTPHGFVPMGVRSDTSPRYDMKTPMTATFKEEEAVREAEETVTKIDRKDLRVKLRIRIAKIFLRCINFSCSLVVLALVASALVIFHATKNLPERNGLPPWAANSPTWPQITLCAIAAVSLVLSSAVLFSYWLGGHRRAEKMSIYWTAFSIATFIFAIVMWGVAAGVLNGTKATGEGKDIWGWSCKDNKRRMLFEEDINYALVCQELDWAFMCALIEVSVELVTIAVYAFAFYRIASKRKLRKSMDVRDKARSELWLAKLREQEGPDAATDANTQANAGLGIDPYSNAEEGFAPTDDKKAPAPFTLAPAPKSRHHIQPVSLNSSPVVPQSSWSQPSSYDPNSIVYPGTPANAYDPNAIVYPNQSQQPTTSYDPTVGAQQNYPPVPPTPSSVRFNLNPSPPPPRN